ncbi:hypothetical protein C8A05DRAFT_37700 [Staphylotrichum tortipilum]|uniref:Uncharacterized protein n=1 Tax=Staphylotrichum tortipilum TaxID=2831512 RepID=A0AAN6RQQ8_9PEZI|nr:hypothetical protein C8A05DRAFT_37700 [Staphylotrichum longicolle]
MFSLHPSSTIPVQFTFDRRWSSHIPLRPIPDVQQQWFDTLRTSPKSIRSVTVDTYSDPYYNSNRMQAWGVDGGPVQVELTADYYRALHSLSGFPNVNDIALRFTSDCVGRGNDLGSFCDFYLLEDHEHRIHVLDAFFKATAALCRAQRQMPGGGDQRLSTLTVRNLQNTPDEHVTSSDDFRETIRDMTALHLQICTEWNDDHALSRPDMVNFWGHLRSRWLEPLADQLETLTLYWDIDWGLYPLMDLRGLHFPRLKSLSLGTYVFGVDAQLDWLLSHKTLEHLSLDSCAICTSWNLGPYDDPDETPALRFALDNLAVREAYDPKGIHGPPADEWIFEYHSRWPTYFGRIAKELPALRRFQFGDAWDPWGYKRESEPNPYRDTRFEDRHLLGGELPGRYVDFMDTDHYEDTGLPGAYNCEESHAARLLDGEQKALDELLDVVRERNENR